MKVYAKRDGIMLEAEVPDGAIYLELNSTDNGAGKRLPLITAIDWENRTYQRLGPWQPFPERFYCESDIEWRPSKIGSAAALTLQEIQ